MSDLHAAPRSGLAAAGAIVLALAAFRYVHDVLKLWVQAPFNDLGSFYTFTAAFRLGVDPFVRAELERVGATLHAPLSGTPPTFTPAGYLIFWPLTALPFALVKPLWIAVGQVCLIAALVVLHRCLGVSPLLGALGLVVALTYQPILEDIALGNLNLLVLFLVALACAAHVRGHRLAAALPLSWAINLKLPYLLLVAFLYWIGARQTALLALALGVGWAGLGVAVFGSYWLEGYARFLTAGSAALHAWSRNLSPHAILHRLLRIDGPSAWVDAVAITLALGVVAWVLWVTAGSGRSREAALAAWATAVAALPLVSPLTEEVHLVVLLLPLAFVISRLDRLPARGDVVAVVVATVLLGSRYSFEAFPAFARGLPSLAYAGKTLGAAALAVVAGRLARRGPS